jgi:hypothetical protein
MTTTDTTAAELAARHLDCSDVKETSTSASIDTAAGSPQAQGEQTA